MAHQVRGEEMICISNYRSFCTVLAVSCLCVAAKVCAAPSGEPAPAAGNYACVTAQYTPNVVMSGGTVQMMPAIWGDIVIDGKGGYRLTRGNGSGRYTYTRTNSKLSFSGSLATATVSDYSGKTYGFRLRGGGMEWICSIARPKPAVASTPPMVRDPSAPNPYSGTDRFSGKYVGSYYCRGNWVEYWMAMQARPDGTLAATLHFGDTSTPPGSYALTGSWQGNEFVLKPDHWISQPEGYAMGGITGQLDGYRFTGRLDAQNCSVMTGRKYE
jgi:hypothetical protein